MCETNNSRAVCDRVWPPVDATAAESDIDEIWDDSELLEHYEQVEMNVKAQVEAFRAGHASLPSQRSILRNQAKRCKRNFLDAKIDPIIPDSFHDEAEKLHNSVTPISSNSTILPVYPWLPPSTELLPDMPFVDHSSASNLHCSCNHRAYEGFVQEHDDSSPPQLAPPASASNEINIPTLLRAWYEAGYAMGQAHAEQVLNNKNSKACVASIDGNTVK